MYDYRPMNKAHVDGFASSPSLQEASQVHSAADIIKWAWDEHDDSALIDTFYPLSEHHLFDLDTERLSHVVIRLKLINPFEHCLWTLMSMSNKI